MVCSPCILNMYKSSSIIEFIILGTSWLYGRTVASCSTAKLGSVATMATTISAMAGTVR